MDDLFFAVQFQSNWTKRYQANHFNFSSACEVDDFNAEESEK
jgi:hypothetical protein